MTSTLWSRIPVIVSAIFAALCLLYACERPALNFDAVPYAALAKEFRGAGGKAEAYKELEAKVGEAGFGIYVGGPYREHLYRDDAFFEKSMPLYSIRPFYILLVSALGAVIHSDVTATYVVSAVATALAVLLSLLLAARMGIRGTWRLGVPLIWVASLGINMASLSTPDGLETLLFLSFVFVWLSESRRPVRIVSLVVLAALMVTTRTDAVLLLLLLMGTEIAFETDRRTAILVGVAALASYLLVQKLSGNYGYIAVLNFQLIEERAHTIIPNVTPSLSGYLVALRGAIGQILGKDPQGSLFTVALCLLVFVAAREYRARSQVTAAHGASRMLVLAVGLVAYLVARFALFPAPWARYMAGAYVVSGLLFVRPIQPAQTLRCAPADP